MFSSNSKKIDAFWRFGKSASELRDEIICGRGQIRDQNPRSRPCQDQDFSRFCQDWDISAPTLVGKQLEYAFFVTVDCGFPIFLKN